MSNQRAIISLKSSNTLKIIGTFLYDDGKVVAVITKAGSEFSVPWHNISYLEIQPEDDSKEAEDAE